jgi:hypothetical protein
VTVYLENVKEFKGDSVTNEKVIEYDQARGAATSMAPALKQHGLGYTEPGLVEQTAQKVATYMGVTTLPKTESMSTHKFVGTVKLTDAEAKSTEERSKKYMLERARWNRQKYGASEFGARSHYFEPPLEFVAGLSR